MLKIGSNQVCQFSTTCKFNETGNCQGAMSSRSTEFTCNLVSQNGVFVESGFRNPLDQTGKMKILMENG